MGLQRVIDWLCLRVWLLIPLRWDNSRLWWWLLPYAGRYAYSEPPPSHWGPKLRALWFYLKATGLRIGGVTWGEEAATAESRAEALLGSLKSIARGEYEDAKCDHGVSYQSDCAQCEARRKAKAQP